MIYRHGNYIDPMILNRIIKLLATPIRESRAWQLGLINDKGKQIKIPRTIEEKDSLTMLNRLVFRIQGLIIRNNPLLNMDKEFRKRAGAMWLVRECYERNYEPLNLENIYRRVLDEVTDDDVEEFKTMISETIIPFSVFSEDAPANNSMATDGIERPETFLGMKKRIRKERKKKAGRQII